MPAVNLGFTRLANTTAYSALTLVTPNATGGPTVPDTLFPNSGNAVSGSGGYIVGANMVISGTVSSDFNMLLFSAALGGGFADGTALTLTAAQAKTLTAVVPFKAASSLAAVTAGTLYYLDNIELPFRLSPTAQPCVLLQTVGGFTPLSAQTFSITLLLDQN